MWFQFVPKVSAAVSEVPVSDQLKSTDLNTLCRLNPLCTYNANSNTTTTNFGTVGGIISYTLGYIFPLAGILLFVLVLASGIQMAAAGMNGNQNSFNAGKKRLISAIIGFVIVFSAYLIMSLIQFVLGIQIDGL